MYNLANNDGRQKEVSFCMLRRERTYVTPLPTLRQKRGTTIKKEGQ